VLVGFDHLIDVKILNASKEQREAIDPLFHDLHDPVVAGPAERRIGVSDAFPGYRTPAVDAPKSPVSLHGSDRTGVQFVVDEIVNRRRVPTPIGRLSV
jgi:hypothetical protein